MSFYTAQLTGKLPFGSFVVPGTNPSVVINRRVSRLDAEATKALKKALASGKIPGVKADNVLIQEVKGPGKPAAEASGDTDALEAEITELKGQLEAARTPPADGHAADVLDSLTVEDLKGLAEKRKVELDSKATKPEIVAALLTPVAS